MRNTKQRFVFFGGFLFCLLTTTVCRAQVYYASLDNQGLSFVSRANPDGTGITSVPINPPQPDFPTWSRDGEALAVVSTIPGRPNETSRNVYTFNANNGQIRAITDFEDSSMEEFVPDIGFTLVSRSHFPRYTAFSPNNDFLALVDFELVATNFGTDRIPTLRVIRMSDLVEVTVARGAATDTSYMSGEGLDWSPVADLLVTPIPQDGFAPGGIPTGAVTALALANSSGDPVRVLTNPRSTSTATLFPVRNTITNEHDYQPAFSPTGNEIAYFRVIDGLTTGEAIPFPQRLTAQVSLRVVGVDGSNDREIRSFTPGFFPQGLTWSPDGSELAFGIGQQAAVSGSLTLAGDTRFQDVFVVDANGNNPRRIATAPATFPTWRPASGSSSSSCGDFDQDGDVDSADRTTITANWTGALGNGVGNQNFADGDCDGDGDIDSSDATGLVQNWTGAQMASRASIWPETNNMQFETGTLESMQTDPIVERVFEPLPQPIDLHESRSATLANSSVIPEPDALTLILIGITVFNSRKQR